MTISQTEFINSEVAVWGEDYIFDLIDSGYVPMPTTNGWRWFAPTSPALDFAREPARLPSPGRVRPARSRPASVPSRSGAGV